MKENRTAAILERVPAILAVTASSYGLSWQAGGARSPTGQGERRQRERNSASGSDKPTAQR